MSFTHDDFAIGTALLFYSEGAKRAVFFQICNANLTNYVKGKKSYLGYYDTVNTFLKTPTHPQEGNVPFI